MVSHKRNYIKFNLFKINQITFNYKMEILNNATHQHQGQEQQTIRRTNRCSFCRGQGHRINSCNNIQLSNTFELLKNKFSTLMQSGTTRFGSEMDLFMNTIGITMLRAVSIRFCGSRLNDNEIKMKNDIMTVIENDYIVSHIGPYDNLNVANNPLMREFGDALISHDDVVFLSNIIDVRYISLEGTLIIDEPQKIKEKPNIMLHLNDTNQQKENDVFSCCICMNDDILQKEAVKINCNHEFCNDCLKQCVTAEHLNCPICRKEINSIHINFKNNFDSWKSIVREK